MQQWDLHTYKWGVASYFSPVHSLQVCLYTETELYLVVLILHYIFTYLERMRLHTWVISYMKMYIIFVPTNV